MRYKSDIFETIHESATEKFHIGAISEAEMREFDKLCLTKKALKNKTVHGAAANIEHADLITA
jgi:DNA-binding transcriptional regulator YiaG